MMTKFFLDAVQGVPNVEVATTRAASFFGSALFTVLWELAKQLFAVYVSNFQSYNKFYGSIGALMIFLMWIFYSASIFLFAASVSMAACKSGAHPRRHHRPMRR